MIDSLGKLLPEAARRFGEKTALVFEERHFSFAELDQLSNRLANGLRTIGIQAGDRVSLYSPNCWEWIVSYYGVLKSGGVINPLNVMLTPEEVEYAAGDCGASAILGPRDKIEPVLNLKERTAVKELICFGQDTPASAVSFDDLLEQSASEFSVVPVGPDTLSTIGYTSGTTGHPKGAMHSHRNVVMNTAMTALMHGRTEADTVVTALPCPHVYGNVVMNAAVMNGMTLVLHSSFKEETVLESIARNGATMFEGVPTMYMFLLNFPELDSYDLSSLRICTVGGQTMPVPKMREVESRFGCPLIELWGMTEIAGLGTTFAHNGPIKHGSIGVTIPYVQARIVDVEDLTRVLPTGEIGELMISGPMVMLGYYRNAEATRETVEPDGWLHTGDLAQMDDEACIFIVDRKKDMILTAGYNIYPAELERVLAGHPDVAMAAVGAIPDETKGELAKAYIIPKEGKQPNAGDVIEYCRQHLAAYKVPRAVQFVNDLPRTSSGKIMRRKLRDLDE